jgi:hypothetical protein
MKVVVILRVLGYMLLKQAGIAIVRFFFSTRENGKGISVKKFVPVSGTIFGGNNW